MFCFKCGKEIENTSIFCKYCGVQVKEDKNEKLSFIMKELQNGDSDAFYELYAETQKYVRYIVRQAGIEESGVEDVVQEVYITIFQKIHSLENPQAAWGWIKTIAHNAAISAYRKNAKYVLVSDEDSEYVFDHIEEQDMLALPEDAMDNKDTQRLIAEMLNELPSMQRLVMIDFYFNEKKVREISADYGIAEGTIKSYLAKGRKGMEERLIKYQNKSGVKLYTMPLAPVLYMVIKEGIQSTVATASVSAAVTAVTVGTSNIIQSTSVQTTAQAAVKTTAKVAVTKAVAGVTAAVVVGTGVTAYVVTHDTDKREIQTIIEAFEDACKALDDKAIKECMSEESFLVLRHYDLTSEYISLDDQEMSIADAVDFDLDIANISIQDDEASAYCTYIYMENGKEKTKTGYLGLHRENGEWKLELCRENKNIYREGTWTTNARFPELIEKELIYNDELE